MRWLAAAMVVVAGAGLGFAMADIFCRRPRQLRQLQFALAMLGAEIRYRHLPLPAAMDKAGRATPGPVGELFRSLATGLEQADGRGLAWVWQQLEPSEGLALSTEDLRVLGGLMQVLGTASAEEEDRQLRLHLEHFLRLEHQAEQERITNEKIWRYLGVLAGLALVLILL